MNPLPSPIPDVGAIWTTIIIYKVQTDKPNTVSNKVGKLKLNYMPLNDNLPVGSVIIWAGDSSDLPANWKVCNGKPLKKSDHSELYSILGTNWDSDKGYHADFFNIPDLRGVFLRGINDERNDGFQDFDIEDRIRLKGDSTLSKDLPGSYQKDAIKKHSHEIVRQSWGGQITRPLAVSGNHSATDGDLDGSARVSGYDKHTVPLIIDNFGGDETHPVNAYVYFIIKIKPVL